MVIYGTQKKMIGRIKSKFREAQEDFHLYELIKGASLAFGFRVLSAGLAFGLSVILARKLGAEDSGIFFLGLTIVLIVSSIGCMGMENSLVRFIAANASAGRPGKVLGVYQMAILYSLAAASLISIPLYLLAPWMSQFVFSKPNMVQPFTIMVMGVVPLSLLTLHAYALQGLRKIAASITVLSIIIPLITSTVAILFASDFGINAVAWGYLFAIFISLLLGRLFWKQAIRSFNADSIGFERIELLASSMPLFGMVFMSLLIAWSPMLFLGVWETSGNIGIYSVASRTAMLTGVILNAVNSIAAPKFSSLYQQGDVNALGKIARQSTKFITILATPILLLFLLLPEWVLSIFGEQFKQGAIVLMIISVGQFVNVATGSVGNLLMMTGHERLLRNNLIFSAFTGILLSVWLIPRYGIVGAAVSTAFILSIQNLIAVVQVRMKLGIMPIPWVRNV